MPWKVSHIINVACNVSSSEEEEDDMEETDDDAEEEHDSVALNMEPPSASAKASPSAKHCRGSSEMGGSRK